MVKTGCLSDATEHVRGAFTIIYMDKDATMKKPEHRSHEFDALMWLPGVKPGEIPETMMNPVLYARHD